MKKSQIVALWAVGFFSLTTIALFIVFVFQMKSVDSQYTEPGIADYRNGNYPKAIQELNTSIKLNGSNPYAYYYLGLSLKKREMYFAHTALS